MRIRIRLTGTEPDKMTRGRIFKTPVYNGNHWQDGERVQLHGFLDPDFVSAERPQPNGQDLFSGLSQTLSPGQSHANLCAFCEGLVWLLSIKLTKIWINYKLDRELAVFKHITYAKASPLCTIISWGFRAMREISVFFLIYIKWVFFPSTSFELFINDYFNLLIFNCRRTFEVWTSLILEYSSSTLIFFII